MRVVCVRRKVRQHQVGSGGTPTSLCVAALGWSNTVELGGVLLPFDFGAVGMTGCDLLQSTEAFGLSTDSTGPPVAVFSFGVAHAPAPAGSHIYTQAFSYAPGANPLQVIVPNGIDWLIGYWSPYPAMSIPRAPT